MSDIIYNSYNYNTESRFEPLIGIKKLKNQPFIQITQKQSEVEAFFSEKQSQSVGLSKIIFTNKKSEDVDYSKQYLTFEALEDTTFKFSRNKLQYSLDDGETWTELPSNTNTPTIKTGNKIMWKQTGLTPYLSNGIGTFSATGKFNAYGNIMSLHYGDDFDGKTDLTGKEDAFSGLFGNCSNLINVENLILSATTLADNCYSYIFSNCTSLTTPPVLPVTVLATNCYRGMFQGCTSLTTAPELPATTLEMGCYDSMFYGCTSLTTVPELPATTLANSCYQNMFQGCTSLKYLKILYTGSDSPGSMSTVSSEGDLYLYSKSLSLNNLFLRGFNGWRLYLNDKYSGIIEVSDGGGGGGDN